MALVWCSCFAEAAQAKQLLPVDEAAKDPSFLAFRKRLHTAVRAKDHRFVLSIVAPDIIIDFGADKEVSGFQKKWRPERKDSKLWPALEGVLTLGGSFEDGWFVAPYVYSEWPEELDSVEYQAVLGREVPARSGPDPAASVVATLSHDLVKVAPDQAAGKSPGTGWTKIIIPGGKSAFVPSRSLRSAMGYRAAFAKVNGQ